MKPAMITVMHPPQTESLTLDLNFSYLTSIDHGREPPTYTIS